MKVSAKEQYGLRAIAELAERYGQGPISLNDVAQAQGISLAYLEQVICDLRDAELVTSTRGAHGGYELARPPREITIGAVLRALEGDILPVQCVRHEDAQPCARGEMCAARTVWEQVHRRVVDVLDRMTLADLDEQRTESEE
ncbi:MAG: Rrf2 family transcriptional regulator [Anaerolineae bacterium]|nr:Rrf2 family transcriptional regulator [Anaerolineae bacterium]